MPEIFTLPAKRQTPFNKVDDRHIILRSLQSLVAILFILATLLFSPSHAAASITPITWDTIGLDSNSPTLGPAVFPVGARITGPANTSGSATLVWDAGGTTTDDTYIKIYNNQTLNFTFDSSGNADVYFTVVIATRDSSAYNQTRRYHISSGGVNSVTRELFIEHLVSQGRNGITDIRVGTTKTNMVSVPNGGSFSLLKDNTYYVQLVGYTATSGYEQLESFINFDNTVIQILSVEATASAGTSPISQLYADACSWDADPSSLSYRSCTATGKFGGSITVTYQIKVLSVGSGSQQLNSLIHDFSGSSFHYNSDYSTTARTMNLINPANATIAKSFIPDTTAVNGVSKLTITLTNPNGGALTGASFKDLFPTSPGGMKLYDTAINNTCGGQLNDYSGNPLVAMTSTGISLTGGTIPANGTCVVQVNVTAPVTGTYNNITENLFIGAVDTGNKSLTATLVADDSAIAHVVPPSTCPGSEVTLATWNFDSGFSNNQAFTSVTGSGLATGVSSATATIAGSTASYATNTTSSSASYSWAAGGWPVATPATATSQAYVDFVVNTYKYGGLMLNFAITRTANNTWGGSNYFYVWSQDDSNGFSAAKGQTALSTTWTSYTNIAAVKTGSNATTFRVNAAGSKSSAPANSILYLDTVTIKGCAAPAALPPPSITKAFATNPVAVNGTSVLTFTLTNTNTTALTGVKFKDALPAGLEVAATPAASTTCGGTPTWAPAAGDKTLNFGQTTGATIPAKVGAVNGSCTVTVTIKATTAGDHQNVSGMISSNESGANTTLTGFATASLTALLPPAITKNFSPNPILSGGTSTLTFAITNPNPGNALTKVNFNDDFSATSIRVYSSPNQQTIGTGCSAATFTANPGASSISISGGIIPAGATCVFTADVTTTSTGNNSVTVYDTDAGTGNTASDTLTVTPANPVADLFKEVATGATQPPPDSVSWRSDTVAKTGDPIYYQFTIQNDGNVPLTNVKVTDASYQTALDSCTWHYSDGSLVGAANGSFDLKVTTRSSIDDLAYCIISTTAATGTHTNQATASYVYNGTTYNTPNPSLDPDEVATYYGFNVPTVAKAFGTGNITSGGNTTLTLTLGNPSANPGNLTSAKVDDPFPTGMTLKDTTFTFTPAACGTVTRTDGTASVAGDNAVRFTAGSIAANTTCQAQVNITSSTVGSVTNTTGTTSATGVSVAGKTASLDLTGGSASASLTVNNLPNLIIAKSAVVSTGNPKARPGDTITYTVTVTETNGTSPDLNSVILSDFLKDSISNYVDLRVDTYGIAPYRPFSLSPGTSGLTLGLHEYSADSGTSWVSNNPPNTSGSYDPTITNWRLTLNGTMAPLSSFSLSYSVKVK